MSGHNSNKPVSPSMLAIPEGSPQLSLHLQPTHFPLKDQHPPQCSNSLSLLSAVVPLEWNPGDHYSLLLSQCQARPRPALQARSALFAVTLWCSLTTGQCLSQCPHGTVESGLFNAISIENTRTEQTVLPISFTHKLPQAQALLFPPFLKQTAFSQQ